MRDILEGGIFTSAQSPTVLGAIRKPRPRRRLRRTTASLHCARNCVATIQPGQLAPQAMTVVFPSLALH